jgi:hypothetical protein
MALSTTALVLPQRLLNAERCGLFQAGETFPRGRVSVGLAGKRLCSRLRRESYAITPYPRPADLLLLISGGPISALRPAPPKEPTQTHPNGAGPFLRNISEIFRHVLKHPALRMISGPIRLPQNGTPVDFSPEICWFSRP